jgi:hypothetical protein
LTAYYAVNVRDADLAEGWLADVNCGWVGEQSPRRWAVDRAVAAFAAAIPRLTAIFDVNHGIDAPRAGDSVVDRAIRALPLNAAVRPPRA